MHLKIAMKIIKSDVWISEGVDYQAAFILAKVCIIIFSVCSLHNNIIMGDSAHSYVGGTTIPPDNSYLHHIRQQIRVVGHPLESTASTLDFWQRYTTLLEYDLPP